MTQPSEHQHPFLYGPMDAEIRRMRNAPRGETAETAETSRKQRPSGDGLWETRVADKHLIKYVNPYPKLHKACI